MKLCSLKTVRFGIRISMSFYSQHLFLLGFLGLCSISGLVLSQNHTLIFSKDNNIRNCSCSSNIHNCDYNLANLECSCKTVHPKNKTGSRLSYSGNLTIWFSDTSTLGKLVNFTFVQNLKLSLCGTTVLPTEYLAILGLRHLRVQTEDMAEQSVIIYSCSDEKVKDGVGPCPTSRDKQSQHISYLDTSVFSGLSLVKSYSVENISSVLEHFPNLPVSNVITTADTSYIVTLIY
ncbi:uncharacterized protein C21orf62 homolog [Rana temporaria]|uniref:uncharacterized protein C21orf62 homolog n=1 Tax=Rana temporaria TaxID=8407 RepID=UPI001AADAD96|nr:uncharacterized protein C21orf62 homolog [Rana temporaria]XP_040194822.1 uncharacterized protein C21orf62 homolog [Rana temporaria]